MQPTELFASKEIADFATEVGKEAATNQALDAISFVTLLRDAIGGGVVIKALHATSLREWENAFDANTQEHLVKGVFTSAKKTDFIRVYISKLIAQYMNTTGVRITAWTKNTISGDNTTNVAIANRIAATEYEGNDPLFTLVATRLMGFDDKLVEYALLEKSADKAAALVDYLASKLELTDGTTAIGLLYPAAIDFIEEKLETNGFTPDYFAGLLVSAVQLTNGSTAPLDPLDLLTKATPIE